MIDELREKIEEYIDSYQEADMAFKDYFPDNPPNEVCNIAFLRGISIDNSIRPKVGELNALFETDNEKLYVWTHDENTSSAIISSVNTSVKEMQIWKTVGSIIWMAMQYAKSFTGIWENSFEYKWIYHFNNNSGLSEQQFYNLDILEEMSLKDGEVKKVTDIGNLSPEIELMLRDDKAYVAMMMLCNSFIQHPICLICELSSTPYHDHRQEEPEIWEHAMLICKMENAIVQACRSVEGILGEPPNASKQSSVLRHKDKWKQLLGLNPDEIYTKAGISYLDFYYSLFFKLRNPSAHSYGNIHYELERSKTIQAQCFATIIIKHYFQHHILSLEDAKATLHFNEELLARVDDTIITEMTV